MGSVSSVLSPTTSNSSGKYADQYSPARLQLLSNGRILLAANLLSQSERLRSSSLAKANSGAWIESFLTKYQTNFSVMNISVAVNLSEKSQGSNTIAASVDCELFSAEDNVNPGHGKTTFGTSPPILQTFLNECPHSYSLVLVCSLSVQLNSPHYRKSIGCPATLDALSFLKEKLKRTKSLEESNTQLSVREESVGHTAPHRRTSFVPVVCDTRVSSAATQTLLRETQRHVESTVSSCLVHMDFMSLHETLRDTHRWARDLLSLLETLPVGVAYVSSAVSRDLCPASETQEDCVAESLKQCRVLFCNEVCLTVSSKCFLRDTATPFNSNSNSLKSAHDTDTDRDTNNSDCVAAVDDHKGVSFSGKSVSSSVKSCVATRVFIDSNDRLNSETVHLNSETVQSSSRKKPSLLTRVFAMNSVATQDSLTSTLPIFQSSVSCSVVKKLRHAVATQSFGVFVVPSRRVSRDTVTDEEEFTLWIVKPLSYDNHCCCVTSSERTCVANRNVANSVDIGQVVGDNSDDNVAAVSDICRTNVVDDKINDNNMDIAVDKETVNSTLNNVIKGDIPSTNNTTSDKTGDKVSDKVSDKSSSESQSLLLLQYPLPPRRRHQDTPVSLVAQQDTCGTQSLCLCHCVAQNSVLAEELRLFQVLSNLLPALCHV